MPKRSCGRDETSAMAEQREIMSVMDEQFITTVQKMDLNLGWRGPRFALLAASRFMLILDSGIVIVTLPSIGQDLHLTQQDLSWVSNGYTLLFGGFLILGGRLGDLVGRRRLFVSGLVLFTAASLVGALAPSPGWLIAARGMQGFAAAVISPTALSLVLVMFPNCTPDETVRRNKALGIMGAVAAAGGAVGLFAGGVLTDLWGWESIFYVNVPIGLFGIALAARLLPADSIVDRPVRFDVVGAITITGGSGWRFSRCLARPRQDGFPCGSPGQGYSPPLCSQPS